MPAPLVQARPLTFPEKRSFFGKGCNGSATFLLAFQTRYVAHAGQLGPDSTTLLLLLFAGTIFCEFLRFGKNRKIKYPQKFLPTHHHCGVCTITNCVMLATFGAHANHSLLIFSAFSFLPQACAVTSLGK